MTPTRSLFAALALLSLAAPVLAQKGKPTPPPPQPATLTFRCAYVPPPGTDTCATLDGIRGDGAGAYAALLEGQGEAYMELKPADNRFLFLDFSSIPATSGARRYFDKLEMNSLILRTNVVDDSGNTVEGGLRSLAIDEERSSRLYIPFNTVNPTTGEAVAWALRFYPAFAPSTHVTVRRTSLTSWEIEATGGDGAVLVSGARRTQLIEGPFIMPFKATLTLTTP